MWLGRNTRLQLISKLLGLGRDQSIEVLPELIALVITNCQISIKGLSSAFTDH